MSTPLEQPTFAHRFIVITRRHDQVTPDSSYEDVHLSILFEEGSCYVTHVPSATSVFSAWNLRSSGTYPLDVVRMYDKVHSFKDFGRLKSDTLSIG